MDQPTNQPYAGNAGSKYAKAMLDGDGSLTTTDLVPAANARAASCS